MNSAIGGFAAPLLAAITLGAACIGGAALAQPYNPGHLDEASRSGVAGLCRNVMGLQPGEEHFDNCMESLSDARINAGRGRAISNARQTCLERGLPPGSPALAECELGGGAEDQQTAAAYPVPPSPGRARSYFLTPNRDIHQREQLSCARLGYEPADSGFQGCVAGLDAALFSADNPAH